MKVAAVQLTLHPRSVKKALDEAETHIRSAARKGARVVCLPEHWLLSHVLGPGDPIQERFQRVAHETKVYLNLGANFQKRRGAVFLTSQTLSPEGGLLSSQDKLHLYRREKKRATPGRGVDVFEVDGHKVGVLVCHDLVFPEPARTLALMGAEMILVPALIEADGASPWSIYLQARALENRVPIVSPNCYWPPHFLGRSTIVSLDYNTRRRIMHLALKSAPPAPGIVMSDLEFGSSRKQREERLDELRNSGAIGSLLRASRLGRG